MRMNNVCFLSERTTEHFTTFPISPWWEIKLTGPDSKTDYRASDLALGLHQKRDAPLVFAYGAIPVKFD